MKRIPVVVDSCIRMDRGDLKGTGLTLRELREPFEYANTEFYKSQRMGFYTGNTPRTLSLFEADSDELRWPRGVWRRLKSLLAGRGVDLVPENRTTLGREIPMGWDPPFPLGPDQETAARMLVRAKTGIVVGPCASGKTVIGIRAINLVGRRALVVVPTEGILEEWISEAKKMLAPATVGALYGKRKEPGRDVVVATNLTLNNWIDKNPGYLSEFGVLVLDEAHHLPASTYAGPVIRFPARYRWALTATPERKDGKHVIFYDAFGSDRRKSKRNPEKMVTVPRVVFEIRDEDLDRYGRIVPVDVVVVPTDFEFDLNLARAREAAGFEEKSGESGLAAAKRFIRETRYEGGPREWGEMLSEMPRDAYRQARILEFLLPEVKAKEPALLLSDRRETSLDLYAWLRRRDVVVGRLMGGDQSKEQKRVKDLMAAGKLRVAVGTTQIAGEGLNIKPLSRGYACTPTATNVGRLVQNVGRFKRISPGKKDAAFFYFWDRRVRGLIGHPRVILNSIPKPHRVWYADRPGRENWRPLDRDAVKELEKEARAL